MVKTTRGKVFTALLYIVPTLIGLIIAFVFAHFDITRAGTALLIGVAVGVAEFLAMRFVFQRTGLLD